MVFREIRDPAYTAKQSAVLPANQENSISWIRRQFLRQYSLLQLGENTEFRFSLCFSEDTQSPYIYLH